MHLEQRILGIHLREISQFYRVKLHICRLKQAQGESPPLTPCLAGPIHEMPFPSTGMAPLIKKLSNNKLLAKFFLLIDIIEMIDIMS